eukprot:snap_masked-scaffold_6-processed-gene-18.23-mRNA-1 protein AED:1.00 eAED:1.00 QI:0/0/0/0/1/1/2/0/112
MNSSLSPRLLKVTVSSRQCVWTREKHSTKVKREADAEADINVDAMVETLLPLNNIRKSRFNVRFAPVWYGFWRLFINNFGINFFRPFQHLIVISVPYNDANSNFLEFQDERW